MATRTILPTDAGESVSTALAASDPDSIVTLDDLKRHCKVDVGDDDLLIAALRDVAIETVETNVQRALLPKTVEWITDALVHPMRLPLAPVAQVRFIKYLPYPYGSPAVTLDPSYYFVSPDGQATVINKKISTIYPFVGQGNEPVVVRFDAGKLPVAARVVHAIRLIVAGLYEYRTPFTLSNAQMSELPLTCAQLGAVEALLYPERWD